LLLFTPPSLSLSLKLHEANEVLKEELSNWWNWAETQKEGFATETAQAFQTELTLQQG
jgi:hypothetical protein